MLARSLVALLSGALIVAAVPGRQEYNHYEEYDNPQGHQWVAAIQDSFPGAPKQGPPPPPGPPHGPPPHGPHHAPPHPKVDDKTIFQALEDDDRCVFLRSDVTHIAHAAPSLQVLPRLQAR